MHLMTKKIAAGLSLGIFAAVFSWCVVVAPAGATSSGQASTKAKTTKAEKPAKVSKSMQKKLKKNKRTIPGVVVSVGANSIVIKKGNKTYTAIINTAADGTKIVDRLGGVLQLSDFKVNHKVSLRGSVMGTEIVNVVKLRNITLPILTTETEKAD